MDTRWKRFRYGTEERNPSWSFFGAVLFPALTMIAFSMLYQRGSGFGLMTGLWSLVFSGISFVHLGQLMKNEKENLIPIRVLDQTCPDLMLFLLLCMLFFFLCCLDWHGNSGWWSYSHMISVMFSHWLKTVLFWWELFFMLFMTSMVVLFTVILYMSVMRQRNIEKLCKKLFFSRLKVHVQKRLRAGQKKREQRLLARLEQREAGKIFRRRQFLPLGVQGTVLVLGTAYIGAVYGEEELMFVLVLAEIVCLLADVLLVLKNTGEIGILLAEIRQAAEDEAVWEEPMLKRTSIFRRSEEMLMNIRKTKKESVEKQLRSERMKVDLITNVSHDLKTPLTSMIGCIDLLKQVEELPQEAQDYVELLSAKAERLRGMIQDVFDMAKATSGGQDLQMERLDMARLLRQTAADMQDRIDRSGLHYRMKIQDGELSFLGDSKKMYRVYQNLLENTLKYSMEGSRVYVEVSMKDGKILTSIKNTSGCEMDFSAEEIMERFTRGDKSRSTEGNGLGLAIARSFTEACGGSFQVTLDGDLFRVDTEFPMLPVKD